MNRVQVKSRIQVKNSPSEDEYYVHFGCVFNPNMHYMEKHNEKNYICFEKTSYKFNIDQSQLTSGHWAVTQ